MKLFPHHWVESGKLRAFLIHLSASAAVVSSIGALMLLLWFPQPWFMHDGGWTVFRLILLVDVVLGPLLTLIVFRRGKSGLRRDLTVIVAVQLGALAFGATTMYQYRPAFVVYGDRNFFTVTWKEVRDATKDIERLRRFTPERGPGIVFLRAPDDPRQKALLRALETADGAPIVSRGDYYDTLSETDWKDIFGRGPSIEQLAREDPAISAELERFRRRNAVPLESFAFIPVVCRDELIILVFDRNTKAIVDWLQ